MSILDLDDLDKAKDQEEILDFLVKEGLVKEKKLLHKIEYERELKQLQRELVRLQQHVIENNKRVLLIFEGRDAAGKGGSIKRFVANINPKRYRVTALPKPTTKEQSQWYFQRYIKHLPSAGEMVFFDRSWYNRAVVEPVFGFCTDAQHEQFMNQVNELEHQLIDDGVVLMKFFLTISKKEQKDRLDDRRENPLKRWKIGGLDEQAQEKWEVYSHYIKKMLHETATAKSPWVEIATDDKKTARLSVIRYALQNVPGFEPTKYDALDESVVKIHT